MIMGSTVTAFAATQTQITISNPDGEIVPTYRYVQIVEPDPTTTIGWKFSGADDPSEADGDEINEFAEAFIAAYDNVTTEEEALNALIETYKTYPERNDLGAEDPNHNAETGTIHASTDLGEALNALRSYANDEVTGNTIPANSAGLYLIIAEAEGYTFAPMLAYVEDAGSGNLIAAKVTAKGSKDQIKKDVDKDSQSVSAGDSVHYTATVEYPYIGTDIQNPKFEIKDTLTNATFDEDTLNITVGGTPLSQGDYIVDYTVPAADGKGNTVMTITFTYDSQYAGQNVQITYDAIVSEDVSSVDNPLRNEIDSNVNDKKTGYEVIVKPTTVTVTKVEQGTEKGLDGAEITIYEEVADYDSSTQDPNVVELKVVDEDATSGDGSIVTVTKYGKKIETLTTNEAGEVTFDGLDAQKTYFVKETKAPEGYSLNDYAYQLSGSVTTGSAQGDLDKDGYDEYVYTSTPFNSEKIQDTKLADLPSTGGIGTTIFTIGGCVIMVTAAGLYFATRKKEQN